MTRDRWYVLFASQFLEMITMSALLPCMANLGGVQCRQLCDLKMITSAQIKTVDMISAREMRMITCVQVVLQIEVKYDVTIIQCYDQGEVQWHSRKCSEPDGVDINILVWHVDMIIFAQMKNNYDCIDCSLPREGAWFICRAHLERVCG